MPLGDLTPKLEHSTVLAKAHELRNAMKDCILSDEAITLCALRVNTEASTAKLARGLGIPEHTAYVILSRPQAQQLIAELATSLLGGAAIAATHTMMRIMKGKDAALAYRAAESLMERSGLGISQRATPDGSTKTVFAFAFGQPQSEQHVALPRTGTAQGSQMGPALGAPDAGDPSKKASSLSGEGITPVILEQGADTPVILEQPADKLQGVRSARPRRVRVE